MRPGSNPFLSARKDEMTMERCLALARRGSGFVAPNPLVGAVVEKDGKIIGSGWHKETGGAHAEIIALREAGAGARGATLYVTLEPCNHFGKTPPCTKAIEEAGIKRVVIGMPDPNPKVAGGGISALEQAGIEVETGVLEEKAKELNLGWVHWVQFGRPFVLLKLAVSLDGCIAAPSGDSKWISSEVSRAHVQRLRRHVDAVMVGSGTVQADNPRLTNRTGKGPQPLRVILDSELSSQPRSNVFRPLGLGERGPSPIAVVFTSARAGFQQRKELELAGVEVIVHEDSDGRVDLEAMLDTLAKRSVQSILCEGGATLASSLIRQGLVNRLMLYQSPLLLGSNGKRFFVDEEIEKMSDAVRLSLAWSRQVGPDNLAVFDFERR